MNKLISKRILNQLRIKIIVVFILDLIKIIQFIKESNMTYFKLLKKLEGY